MSESVVEIDWLRCEVELDDLDCGDIIAAGTVRLAADADELRITVPVDLGALTDTITVTLPVAALVDMMIDWKKTQ